MGDVAGCRLHGCKTCGSVPEEWGSVSAGISGGGAELGAVCPVGGERERHVVGVDVLVRPAQWVQEHKS